jgi:hypothetical protein
MRCIACGEATLFRWRYIEIFLSIYKLNFKVSIVLEENYRVLKGLLGVGFCQLGSKMGWAV